MIIYKIINLVNNKIYIGQSVGDLKTRYKGGKWWKLTHNKLLKNDVKRYGKNKFKIKILKNKIKSLNLLNKLEEFYAKKYDSYFPNGYNLIGCGNNKFLTTFQKKKISQIRIGKYKPANKTKSKYYGVSFDNKHKKYKCKFENLLLKRNRYYIHEKSAGVAHDIISLFLYNGNCILNFPEKIKIYNKINLKKFYKIFIERKKNDLPRNAKPINKNKLIKLYKFMSDKDMSKIFKRKFSVIRFWRKKYNLRPHRKGYLQKKEIVSYKNKFLKRYNSLFFK